MAAIFSGKTLVAADNTIIAIKSIESIKSGRDDVSDKLVDCIRNDIILELVTTSGKEYEISVRRQMTVFSATLSQDLYKAHQSILDQWVHLV